MLGAYQMNSIQIGWIDYSSQHRNKVMAILDLLSQEGAVDELGIGMVRDGFSDILFPGTSTIQTRAKYFFIIPYIAMELERNQYSSYKEFLDQLHEEEIKLIPVLNKNGEEGVIGSRAGSKLKRKPSSIYWNGLRTFEFFKYNLTLEQYARAFVSKQRRQHTYRSLGNEGVEEASLFEEYIGEFWQCLISNSNWREHITMNLTNQEAEYLKEKILKAKKSKDSLLAYLLKQDRDLLLSLECFEDVSRIFELPEEINRTYQMAVDFNEFITGANIRYNVILSNGKNELAVAKWQNWLASSFVKEQFVHFSYLDVIRHLDINNPKLLRFLRKWQEAVLSKDVAIIDELIIKREIELKTKERAKLNNTRVYAYKEGDWVGSERLNYRFNISFQLIKDILKGLEEN